MARCRPVVFASLVTVVLLMTAGCGGSGGATYSDRSSRAGEVDTGAVTVQVVWPDGVNTAATKSDIRSYQIWAVSQSHVSRKVIINPPKTRGTIPNIPLGDALIRARAFSEPNAKGAVLASGETRVNVKPRINANVTIKLQWVTGPVKDEYPIGGTISPSPDVPDQIEITLNAILDPVEGKPLTSLTKDDFEVYEEDIRRDIVSAGLVSNMTTSRADIVFCIDVTGSMTNEIAGVRDSVLAFVDYLLGKGFDVRLGGVAFRDEVVDTFALTRDAHAFHDWVSALDAEGGDDAPENDLDAIYTAVGFDWRSSGTQRVIVVLTDAPTHVAGDGSGFTAHTVDDIINAVKKIGAVLHSVSPREAYGEYPDVSTIASATGGASIEMPNSGNVDLTTLPLSQILLAAYRIVYKTIPTDTDHRVRLVVLLGGKPVADHVFHIHY